MHQLHGWIWSACSTRSTRCYYHRYCSAKKTCVGSPCFSGPYSAAGAVSHFSCQTGTFASFSASSSWSTCLCGSYTASIQSIACSAHIADVYLLAQVHALIVLQEPRLKVTQAHNCSAGSFSAVSAFGSCSSCTATLLENLRLSTLH